MPFNQRPPWWNQPLITLLIVLVVVFLAETAVMHVLPWLLPTVVGVGQEAIVDASLLTLVASPFLWWLIVRPLNRLAEFRTRMLEQILAAQENERRRLARELHDGIGQSLTSLMVLLRAAEESDAVGATSPHTTSIRSIAATIYDEIRRITRGLRPAVLDDLGLAAAFENLLREFQQTQGIATTLKLRPEAPERLAESVEIALYRILQEALNNVARHAEAGQVAVDLSIADGSVCLVIRDDGRGVDPNARSPREREESFGITGMRERALLLGGEFKMDSVPGQGTTVDVRIPLPRKHNVDDSRTHRG